MGGGLMQLVAMGAQDVYLTGNPQITFFKVVYRRHTNFSKECIEQQFNGNIPTTSEGSVTCTLARNGDLVQEIYLKVTSHDDGTDENTGYSITGISSNVLTHATFTLTLNDEIYFDTDVLNGSGVTEIEKNRIYYVQEVVTSTSEIKISSTKGGTALTLTDNITPGTKLFVNKNSVKWQNVDMTKLVKTVEVEIGGQKIDKHYSQWLDIYNELFETSHDLRMAMCNGSDIPTPNVGATNYIPLRFWFNRNPGLALPLIALQYHEVKINMTLDPVNVDGNNSCKIINANLLVNYLYLDTDERRRFAQVSHEYLIEQIQHTGAETAGTIDMTFNHPVKALFWTGATWDNVKLQLNGHDRAAVQPRDYYHLVQPYECGLGHSGKSMDTSTRKWATVTSGTGTGTAAAVGMYSFCLKPAEHQPSGTCNFSRIDNARLNMTGSGAFHLFAMNYNVLRIMSGMGGLAYSN